jgi:ribonuclease BN (tRNA processing enzyme)
MDLTIVGCSGSFPGPESAASSYLVEADGFRLLLDVGNGSLGSLQRYVDPGSIEAVCLSHLHTDHCIDMCSFSVYRGHHPSRRFPRIPVYGPAGTSERLQRASAETSLSMTDSFDFVTLTPGSREIGPITVTTEHMSHPVETFGFRLGHGGRVITYSADTGPTDSLAGLASGADILLCEASFVTRPDLPDGLHLTGAQAGEYAARADVGELVLTHLVPWNSLELVREEAAASYPGTLSLATPGRVL